MVCLVWFSGVFGKDSSATVDTAPPPPPRNKVKRLFLWETMTRIYSSVTVTSRSRSLSHHCDVHCLTTFTPLSCLLSHHCHCHTTVMITDAPLSCSLSHHYHCHTVVMITISSLSCWLSHHSKDHCKLHHCRVHCYITFTVTVTPLSFAQIRLITTQRKTSTNGCMLAVHRSSCHPSDTSGHSGHSFCSQYYRRT